MKLLTQKQCYALYLDGVCKLPQKEAAKRMKVKKSAFSRLLGRARKRLYGEKCNQGAYI